MPEQLVGLIERVTYHNPENGFAVLKVQVKGRRDLVTIVGPVTSVTAGEHLTATGVWTVDRQHGQQFKADDIRTSPPTSSEGIERYLASGAIRSVGPQLAGKIVGIYKERTLEILDTCPDFLLHIRGIGQKRLKRIRSSWDEQREVRKIMLFFSQYGIGSGRALRIYRTYGQEAIERIKSNPYQLADDVRGIGFKTADELAAKLGIDPNSPHRARAAVSYALRELCDEGHVGYPEAGAVERTVNLVEIPQEIVQRAVEEALENGSVVREPIDGEAVAVSGRFASRRNRSGKVGPADDVASGAPSAGDQRPGGDRLGRKTAGYCAGRCSKGGDSSGLPAETPDHHGWSRRRQDDAGPQYSGDLCGQGTALRTDGADGTGGQAAVGDHRPDGENRPPVARIRPGHERLSPQSIAPIVRRLVRDGRNVDGRRHAGSPVFAPCHPTPASCWSATSINCPRSVPAACWPS